MSKIICDVCGTVYQDSADFCPICGYAQGEYPNKLQDTFMAENGSKGPVKQKHIFDYDQEDGYSDSHEDTDPYDDDDDLEEVSEYEAPSRASTIIIVVLVVIITLLLVAIGFLFFRFYLPNQSKQAPENVPAATQIVAEATTEEPTEPTIPCTSLVLTSGLTELNREGQYWLLHVTALPEDTTDELIFTSEDESIVTVNEHGRLTAVGEGETNVFIACGEKEIKCRVVVRFEEPEEIAAETKANNVPEAVDHTDLPEETAAETIEEETKTEEKPASADNIVLKLEEYDLSSTVRGVSFELKLDCDLKPEDVTWLTLDSKVALVKNGLVTTIGPGQTKIVAQYNGQQVECIIRCNF